MSIETRPSDVLTPDHLLIGMPYVEFSPANNSGGYGAYRSLGIIDSAAISKALETAVLKSAQSGTDVIVREIVRSFEGRLRITTFKFDPDNLQLFLAAASKTAVSAGTDTATAEAVTLGASYDQWADLAQSMVSAFTTLAPAPIVAEAVGTGDGTTGDTSGDFALDFKPLLVANVTSVVVGSTSFTPVAVGAASAGNEVEVVVGTGATSGNLQFFVGGVAANVTGAIVASYAPSHTLTENTHFVVDYSAGRVRRISGEQALRDLQPVLATYDYTTFDGYSMPPFTQFTFEGRARIKLITDVGINMIWPIPDVSLKITDTDFEFNKEEFAAGELELTMNYDSTNPTAPYGNATVYSESVATP
jgi:hypothetical protein